MNRLFISLYLDEDVDVLVADLLKARGVQVMTTRDAGQLQRSDAEQLAFATQHGMALVTHNRVDFEVLARSYFDNGMVHSGIIIAARHPPHIDPNREDRSGRSGETDDRMRHVGFLQRRDLLRG